MTISERLTQLAEAHQQFTGVCSGWLTFLHHLNHRCGVGLSETEDRARDIGRAIRYFEAQEEGEQLDEVEAGWVRAFEQRTDVVAVFHAWLRERGLDVAG